MIRDCSLLYPILFLNYCLFHIALAVNCAQKLCEGCKSHHKKNETPIWNALYLVSNQNVL
jgi:hypothetical protein